MKIYRKFNKAVQEFLNKKNVGDNIVLSIDERFITSFCDKYQVGKPVFFSEIKNLFKTDWEFVFERDSFDTPNFFGFIALQIFAAYLMHQDGNYTPRAYNPRFMGLIGIESENQLQQLYREFQDRLWESFKEWCRNKDFELNLPAKTFGTGRYVQYPLSQALLNQDDIEKLPNLYIDVNLKPFENLSFKDFREIAFPVALDLLTPHYYKLYDKLSEQDKAEALEKQVFSHYTEWDGRIPQNFDNVSTDTSTSRVEQEIQTLILDSDLLRLLLKDEQETTLSEYLITDRELFKKIRCDYKLPYKDKNIILFVKNEDYNDWEENRFLKIGIACLIMFEKRQSCLFPMREIESCSIDHSTSNYYIYEINFTQYDDIPNRLKKYFAKTGDSFRLENGLKLSRKIWMEGAGPNIVFNGPVRAWLNGKAINIDRANFCYSCREFKRGKHTLKLPDRTPYYFTIGKPEINEVKEFSGWQISKKPVVWDLDKIKYLISGLGFRLQTRNTDKSEHQEWIDAILERDETKRNEVNSFIVNILNRAKYGLRK